MLQLLSLIFTSIILVNGQCPTLPSGRCFVDCTRSLVYRLVCENVNGGDLYSDLGMYTNTTQKIALFIWGASLDRLGARILSPAATLITELEFDNLVQLKYFPELRMLENLRKVTVRNSPLLDDMPAELLPASVESIFLQRTGITRLYNDFLEVESLPKLKEFVFTHGTLDYIQPGYFSLFPALTHLHIRSNEFKFNPVADEFRTVSELQVLNISRNDFKKSPKEGKRKVLESLLNMVKLAPLAKFDFSNNDLPITLNTVRSLTKFPFLDTLNLRNNEMDDFLQLEGRLESFKQLTMLDLTGTQAGRSKGALRGLPSLQELYLGSNTFGDLSTTNIFEGIQTNSLKILDISNNRLEDIPHGLVPLAKSLDTLNLQDNLLNLEEIYQEEMANGEMHPGFGPFKNLRVLNLRRNSLETFQGKYLANVSNLEILDISCNEFRRVSKEFFLDLPKSLRAINLTFCPADASKAPAFAVDSFSTLPEIETLILQNGFLPSSVFTYFKSIKIDTLRTLDLTMNLISTLPDAKQVTNLKNLKILLLRNNILQSIGERGFQGFPELEQLDLSNNEISSIGKNDFEGLGKLKVLKLSSNSIVDADAGALEHLPELRSFHFKSNLDTNIAKMFGSGGTEIRHLALQNLALPCLPPQLFRLMPMLRWVYMNHSVPLYVGRASLRNIDEDMQREPLAPIVFRDFTGRDQNCDQIPANYFTSQENSVRLVAVDTANQVDQKLLLSLPICHSSKARNLARLISESICIDQTFSDQENRIADTGSVLDDGAATKTDEIDIYPLLDY